MSNSCSAKKRKQNASGANQQRVTNHCSCPIVYLNVGGANRNIRRSLLNDLCTLSGNPIVCDVLLGDAHWSEVPTTTDSDGTVRIYLDRNPDAFDDLLQYIEYRKLFLEELIDKNGEDGTRLKRLGLECDFFTVETLSADVEDVKDKFVFGESVFFRADGWFSIAGQNVLRDGEVVGWRWGKVSGNQSLASSSNESMKPAIAEVKTTGTYLALFSLHSVAVYAFAPTHRDKEEHDEFCHLCVFHEHLTSTECGCWTYPLIRCGAFDYRTDTEVRHNHPLLFTAACVEPISLRKGNQLYCSHGEGGQTLSATRRIGDLVRVHSEFSDKAECAHFMTLIRVFGAESVAKWNVTWDGDHNDEPSTVKWTACKNGCSTGKNISPVASLDSEDNTKIRFKKAGYYLLIGRIAARLKKNHVFESNHPAVQLEIHASDGTPLQIDPEVISYLCGSKVCDQPYNNMMSDYGPVNDVVYAERDSYVCARALRGACFSPHGTVPSTDEKIPTQSLSVMRLDPSMAVDRYRIEFQDVLTLEWAIGGVDNSQIDNLSLFTIVESRWAVLKAKRDCQCFVIGSLSSRMGSIASLKINDEPVVYSQLCKDSGRGSHCLSGIIHLDEGDFIELCCSEEDRMWSSTCNCGHLAFVALGS
ncbi:hypothetical protein HJC23_005723 [Cyclotella cryptica]|uniref:Potassium channel tetramerisation-type BTB domain-containing protein n=1 Tax=Cyclotella cryptica TaxID=29204 RepID=A0ABD3QCR5_9STRA